MATTSTTSTSSGTEHVYQATLTPVNNSGVTGVAIVTQANNSLTVDIQATGLAAHHVHAQQIDGFTSGQSSAAPTTANDSDADGYVESTESMTATGPVLLDLSTSNPRAVLAAGPGDHASLSYPVADAQGYEHYHQVFPFSPGGVGAASTAQALGTLAGHVLEIDGLSVPTGAGYGTTGEANGLGGYKADLPVAAGVLQDITPTASATPPVFTDSGLAALSALHDLTMV